MKRFLPFLFLSLFIIISCENKLKTTDNKPVKLDTIQHSDKRNNSSIGVKLHPKVKKELKDWKEYQLVDVMLSRYFVISNSEALSNAEELSNLVTHLKDSIRDERLKTPSVMARINIFHNECLRLNDMSIIPAISNEEVTLEIRNILEAYAAFNAKLNSIYSIKNIEEEFKIDPDFEKILNDSTIVSPPDVGVLPQKQLEKKNRIGKNRLKNLNK